MPNWCESDLVVTGLKSDLDAFLKKSYFEFQDEGTKKMKREFGLLESHVPMPASLRITSGSCNEQAFAAMYGTDKDVAYWTAMPWAAGAGIKDRTSLLAHAIKTDPKAEDEARIGKENLEKYGSKDWYDWSIKNWGCKWGDSDTRIDKREDKKVKICFSTPWGPPSVGLIAISKKWPTLKFDLKYYEMGMAFKGNLVVKNGETLKQTSGKYNGTRGG